MADSIDRIIDRLTALKVEREEHAEALRKIDGDIRRLKERLVRLAKGKPKRPSAGEICELRPGSLPARIVDWFREQPSGRAFDGADVIAAFADENPTFITMSLGRIVRDGGSTAPVLKVGRGRYRLNERLSAAMPRGGEDDACVG